MKILVKRRKMLKANIYKTNYEASNDVWSRDMNAEKDIYYLKPKKKRGYEENHP